MRSRTRAICPPSQRPVRREKRVRTRFVLVLGALLTAHVVGCGAPPGEEAAPSGDDPFASRLDASAQLVGDSGAPDQVGSSLIGGAEVIGLLGSGLVLRTATGQQITVSSDGTVSLSPPIPVDAAMLTVVTQPVDPSQTCAAQLSAGRLQVSCSTHAYTLSGAVTGLAGTGLTLENATNGEKLAVGAPGTFVFTQRLPDGGAYDVRVATQPVGPRQQCTLAGGSGRVARADASGVLVTCETQRFAVGGNVAGLVGKGLTLTLEAAGATASRTLVDDGKFAFAAVVDGSPYTVKITQQPSEPDQECTVVQGAGVLAGQDVSDVAVVCGALGGLRINEVGTCSYIDSACWIELVNVGSQVEQLAYHKLRTTARTLPTSVRQASYTFALPSLTIEPGAYAVVRAKSSLSLPDGNAVVHVSDAGALPWWDASGFAELLSSAGTVDFVRWGASSVKATSAQDEWLFSGEAAPALPSAYGYAIARDRDHTDEGGRDDWQLRAFATPGGRNDVESDADVDADGVPDVSEKQGGTFAGINVYAMGARVGKRDLFVEIDRMASTDAAVIPRREALDKLVQTFAKRGIALHLDVGPLYATSFDPAAHNLGGGNEVPFNKTVGIGTEDTSRADIYDLKAAHMTAARRSLFYYMLFAWSQNPDGTAGSSGIGEMYGNDTIITLGGIKLKDTDAISRNILINLQALTMMHELGHNMGLAHGGGDKLNGKPNYLSVMNYLYSYGLPTVGGGKEGDRYYLTPQCALLHYINQLTNSPLSDPASFVIDYSDGLGTDLYEASVKESEGLGRSGGQSVDFNCNQAFDAAAYSQDLNFDGRKSDVLEDHDDWSELDFVFRRTVQGSASGSSFLHASLMANEPDEPRDDLLTDDVQEVVDQPCPALRVPN